MYIYGTNSICVILVIVYATHQEGHCVAMELESAVERGVVLSDELELLYLVPIPRQAGRQALQHNHNQQRSECILKN